MKFSERQGLVSARSVAQSDDIDTPLRNSLWNIFQIFFLEALDKHEDQVKYAPEFELIQHLWIHFLKRPVDDLAGFWSEDRPLIREWFFNARWYEVYDLLEFLAQYVALDSTRKSHYLRATNSILEGERSAFRFAGDILTRVSTEVELQAIDAAAQASRDLPGVRTHLATAVETLGDRTNPDYRNSIKESISAVEAMCQLLTGDAHATLGSAIKKLTSAGVNIHPALEKAWSAHYGYTTDKGGIRHAMLDESTLTQADARYMLVSCSAFVSYLVSLAADAKIPLRPI
jgi:hypothetical protein